MRPRAPFILQRPVTMCHPKLTDFHKFSVILGVLKDPSAILLWWLEKLNVSILGSLHNQWTLKPIPEQTRYQLPTKICGLIK